MACFELVDILKKCIYVKTKESGHLWGSTTADPLMLRRIKGTGGGEMLHVQRGVYKANNADVGDMV